MSLVYVFASSKMEAQPVLALAGKNTPVQPGRPVIVEQGESRFAVIITGMGPGNARIKTDAALGLSAPGVNGGPPTAQKSSAVFVIGLCGGLTEAMRQERIIVYSECLSADNSPPLHCLPALTDAIIEILQKHRVPRVQVTGITSPRIASTKSEKLTLARSGDLVVDMESYQALSAARVGVRPGSHWSPRLPIPTRAATAPSAAFYAANCDPSFGTFPQCFNLRGPGSPPSAWPINRVRSRAGFVSRHAPRRPHPEA